MVINKTNSLSHAKEAACKRPGCWHCITSLHCSLNWGYKLHVCLPETCQNVLKRSLSGCRYLQLEYSPYNSHKHDRILIASLKCTSLLKEQMGALWNFNEKDNKETLTKTAKCYHPFATSAVSSDAFRWKSAAYTATSWSITPALSVLWFGSDKFTASC